MKLTNNARDRRSVKVEDAPDPLIYAVDELLAIIMQFMVMENQPFLLVELEDLSAIFNALKTTGRIKYTCFNVSTNYLIFGATSGGLYVFRREPCCFLQILPNKEGSVTQVAFSPDEKLIAFSTIKGIVCILERSSHGAKCLVSTAEHQNEKVTYLQWNDGSNELFIGDNSGKVSIVSVSIFPTKSMFQNPSFVLMQLESKIVQMDFNSNMLLVSTLSKCYICDTSKEIFRQVGHKPRDGEYGACIFNTQVNKTILDSSKTESVKNSEYPNLSHLKLLCARPGSRIWEVAIDGTVISTHHFKKALAVPPKKVHFLNNLPSHYDDVKENILSNGACEPVNSNIVEQSFNFQKLLFIYPKFILTYKTDGIYIFDPEKASVVLWNNEIINIIDVKCVKDLLYVWSSCGKIYALNLVPLEKFLVSLYFQKKYLELAKLCLESESFLLTKANNCSKLYILHDLDEKLKSDELQVRLKPFITLCKESAKKRKHLNAQKLQSGIYLVGNNQQMLLENRRMLNHKLLRQSYLNVKGRSHSVSPERFPNGELKHWESSSSLPELLKEDKTLESLNSPSEAVFNGMKDKETIIYDSKVDIENVSKLLSVIKKCSEPSKEKVFCLFEKILMLCNDYKADIGNNLELVHALPLYSYFGEEDADIISALFHSALKSQSLFEWFSKFTGDWLSVGVKVYPKFLIEHLPVETLELDYKLSKMLKLFSAILIETEIVEIIKDSDMECYYSSLCEVLDIYQDSKVSNIDLTNVTSTPKLLNSVYFLMTIGQMEQCSKYSNKINLQDMFYLLLRFEKRSSMSWKSSDDELQFHSMFLSYLERASEDSKLFVDCTDLVETYIVNCLENIINTASRVRNSNCTCGFPYPNLQPSITMFANVGHALLDRNWPERPIRCIEICSRVPYLWKYFIFLHRNEPLVALSPLLLQTGEIQELENRSHEVTEKVLETYLRHLIDLKNGHCLNCNKKQEETNGTFSWSAFGAICIKLIGPKETLELYKKYCNNISSAELTQSFYQSLIFSSIMDTQNKGLRANVVDLLAGKKMEDLGRMPIFSEKLNKEIFGKNYFAEFYFQNSKFNSHHWGVMVNFKNNCTVCCLPLDTRILISETGLVVFKCAHVFHPSCLKKDNLECPICKPKSAN